MDFEQALIHRVDSGEISAVEAFEVAKSQAAEYGGEVSVGLLNALAERGLVASEPEAVVESVEAPAEEPVVAMDLGFVDELPNAEAQIDPAIVEQTLSTPEGGSDVDMSVAGEEEKKSEEV